MFKTPKQRQNSGLPSCPDAQWIYRFHPDFHHSMCNGTVDLKQWKTWL